MYSSAASEALAETAAYMLRYIDRIRDELNEDPDAWQHDIYYFDITYEKARNQ